ncbi:hypothetical protein CTA2_13088, partial [Colletotrichum tanaceti]
TQANGIPHLLVAPKVPIGPQLPKELQNDDDEVEEGEAVEEDREIYSTGQGDFRGYYQDGAYMARPDTWVDHDAEGGEWQGNEGGYDVDDAEEDNSDPEATIREAYFAAILSHFNTLRKTLHATPPPSIVAALPHSHGYHVGAFGAKSGTFAIWSQRLRATDPHPAQVASMDKDGVLRVLRVILSGSFLRRGAELGERTSRWLWALLARLPERGGLNHAETGWVRDLGRRAVLMMQSLADMAALRDALEGEGMDLGVHDAVDESSDDEDALREMEVDERDGEEPDRGGKAGETPSAASEVPAETTKPTEEADPTSEKPAVEDGEVEEGEIHENEGDDDQKSEAMDVSEDGEVDEGEIAEDPPAQALEEARARLLAQLDTAAEEAPSEEAAAEVDDEARTAGQLRARMNMRVTLTMILTVAGEFYGQRDLLDFRDPFTGM